jgi:hypothetical protein
MPFQLVVMRLSKTSAGVVWDVVAGCVCCCTSIFPKSVDVPPKDLSKLFGPLLTCVVLRAYALASEKFLL